MLPHLNISSQSARGTPMTSQMKAIGRRAAIAAMAERIVIDEKNLDRSEHGQ
jgi:hypothetical protein